MSSYLPMKKTLRQTSGCEQSHRLHAQTTIAQITLRVSYIMAHQQAPQIPRHILTPMHASTKIPQILSHIFLWTHQTVAGARKKQLLLGETPTASSDGISTSRPCQWTGKIQYVDPSHICSHLCSQILDSPSSLQQRHFIQHFKQSP